MCAWVTSEWYHESMEDGGSCREVKAAAEKWKLQIKDSGGGLASMADPNGDGGETEKVRLWFWCAKT